MVTDFKDLKSSLAAELDMFDHAFVVHEKDPLAPFLDKSHATNGKTQRVIIVPWNPTAENFASYIGTRLKMYHQEKFGVVKIRVWETASSFAEWRNPDVWEKQDNEES